MQMCINNLAKTKKKVCLEASGEHVFDGFETLEKKLLSEICDESFCALVHVH